MGRHAFSIYAFLEKLKILTVNIIIDQIYQTASLAYRNNNNSCLSVAHFDDYVY